MADIVFAVIISRDDLGLADLDLNDHVNYYISNQNFLGQTVTFNRNQISSPFIDGQITTFRNMQSIQDQLTLEVLSSDGSYLALMNNVRAAVAAFLQDSYTLTFEYGVSARTVKYQCEAADYTIDYDNQRWIAPQINATFAFYRQPIALVGGF